MSVPDRPQGSRDLHRRQPRYGRVRARQAHREMGYRDLVHVRFTERHHRQGCLRWAAQPPGVSLIVAGARFVSQLCLPPPGRCPPPCRWPALPRVSFAAGSLPRAVHDSPRTCHSGTLNRKCCAPVTSGRAAAQARISLVPAVPVMGRLAPLDPAAPVKRALSAPWSRPAGNLLLHRTRVGSAPGPIPPARAGGPVDGDGNGSVTPGGPVPCPGGSAAIRSVS
jgi:hypothetical protein